jgi:hypothetical protein
MLGQLAPRQFGYAVHVTPSQERLLMQPFCVKSKKE